MTRGSNPNTQETNPQGIQDAGVIDYHASRIPDHVKYGPSILLLKQYDRVCESMALGANPVPAFMAFSSSMYGVAAADTVFLEEEMDLDDYVDGVLRVQGYIDPITYVALYLPAYVNLMHRLKLMPIESIPKNGTESAHGISGSVREREQMQGEQEGQFVRGRGNTESTT